MEEAACTVTEDDGAIALVPETPRNARFSFGGQSSPDGGQMPDLVPEDKQLYREDESSPRDHDARTPTMGNPVFSSNNSHYSEGTMRRMDSERVPYTEAPDVTRRGPPSAEYEMTPQSSLRHQTTEDTDHSFKTIDSLDTRDAEEFERRLHAVRNEEDDGRGHVSSRFHQTMTPGADLSNAEPEVMDLDMSMTVGSDAWHVDQRIEVYVREQQDWMPGRIIGVDDESVTVRYARDYSEDAQAYEKKFDHDSQRIRDRSNSPGVFSPVLENAMVVPQTPDDRDLTVRDDAQVHQAGAATQQLDTQEAMSSVWTKDDGILRGTEVLVHNRLDRDKWLWRTAVVTGRNAEEHEYDVQLTRNSESLQGVAESNIILCNYSSFKKGKYPETGDIPESGAEIVIKHESRRGVWIKGISAGLEEEEDDIYKVLCDDGTMVTRHEDDIVTFMPFSRLKSEGNHYLNPELDRIRSPKKETFQTSTQNAPSYQPTAQSSSWRMEDAETYRTPPRAMSNESYNSQSSVDVPYSKQLERQMTDTRRNMMQRSVVQNNMFSQMDRTNSPLRSEQADSLGVLHSARRTEPPPARSSITTPRMAPRTPDGDTPLLDTNSVPAPWEIRHSKTHNRKYFYNTVTEQSQWSRPSFDKMIQAQDQRSKTQWENFLTTLANTGFFSKYKKGTDKYAARYDQARLAYRKQFGELPPGSTDKNLYSPKVPAQGSVQRMTDLLGKAGTTNKYTA